MHQLSDWGAPGDDPIGAASARLLAAGLSLQERRRALRVLGALLDRAGPGGRLPVGPMTFMSLVGELGLPLEDVLRLRRRLERVGALRRDGNGWVVAGHEHHVPSTVSTVEALDLIAALLDGEQGAPAPLAAAAALPARSPGFVPQVRRSMAVLGIAAAILWVLTVRQPAEWEQPIRGVAAERALESASAPAGPATGARPGSAAPAPQGVASAVPGPVARSQEASAPSMPACPAGAPVATITDLDGSTPFAPLEGRAGEMGLGGPSITVAGLLTNPTGAPVVVREVAVLLDTGGERIAVPVLAGPVTLTPGASAPWKEVVRPVAGVTGTVVAEVTQVVWGWAEGTVPEACGN